ncbi:DUF2505 domain-containing protein [Rhodococcus sp. NPDC058521]|uniref:DUF2505 domain-containing protein n=1 Tax=Rhodococcus sp. NPDC058521 TaxID=3346536 RepID=UPI0036495EA7
MSRRIDHSSTYPFPADKVHSALTSEQYWRDRVAEVGGDGATIDEITVGDGTIAVRMRQAIAAEHLPSIVTKVRPGDLVIKRSETWAGLNDDTATGTFSASVDGAPAKISGTKRLTGAGADSVVEFEGETTVKIPIVGGKIESAIADQILHLIDKEREFTQSWLGR